MALNTYNAYLNGVAQKPVEYWRELMQETVNDDWDNASTIEETLGQTSNGSKNFSSEELRVMSVIDPKTGNALGDDYRKIIYKDFNNASRFLGKYYSFGGETWLTINTNTRIGASKSAILQRCNNSLKWYDSNGTLHDWACVFQRSLSGTSFIYGSEGVPEVDADSIIKVQRNNETNSIPVNQRFLFDGHAFQVRQINNHISDTYLELYIFEIQVQSNDDIENDIANTSGEITPTTNESILLPELTKIVEGDTISFNVYNYINGVKSGDTFSISTNGPVLGINYTLSIIDGNNFTITNLAESGVPLEITCVNNNNGSDIIVKNIILGGIW